MEYPVSQLPEVDAVEVVKLRGISGKPVSKYMRESSSTRSVRVVGDVAQNIARLWRQLPFAEQMRCHIPPYGFRFYQNNQLILQASVCWKCNNIHIDMDGQSLRYTFDAQHLYSQELLLIAKQIMNDSKE